jgi:group I intron endonuclease
MKLIFHEHGNQGGIYKILNLQNGRIYIGSTYRFKNRAKSHTSELKTNRHLNKFLQNDFNKCGEAAFVFEVLEVVDGDRSVRVEREQFHIDQWYDNQKNCYNLVKEARDNRGGTRNKKPDDPTTSGRCKPFSEERLAKHRETLKQAWQDPELRQARKEKSTERWSKFSANITVTHEETGEQVVITSSVKQFCKHKGLSYKAFNQLINGKIKSSGGWFIGTEKPVYVEQKGQVRKPLSSEHRAKIAGGKFAGMKLVKDNGDELVIGVNLKQQCRELGLPYTTVVKVLHGETKTVYGYRLATERVENAEYCK